MNTDTRYVVAVDSRYVNKNGLGGLDRASLLFTVASARELIALLGLRAAVVVAYDRRACTLTPVAA